MTNAGTVSYTHLDVYKRQILDRALAALGVVKILVGAKALGRSRGGIVAVAGHVARGVIARRRPSGNRIYLIASAVAERRVARNGRGHSAGVSAEALGLSLIHIFGLRARPARCGSLHAHGEF